MPKKETGFEGYPSTTTQTVGTKQDLSTSDKTYVYIVYLKQIVKFKYKNVITHKNFDTSNNDLKTQVLCQIGCSFVTSVIRCIKDEQKIGWKLDLNKRDKIKYIWDNTTCQN